MILHFRFLPFFLFLTLKQLIRCWSSLDWSFFFFEVEEMAALCMFLVFCSSLSFCFSWKLSVILYSIFLLSLRFSVLCCICNFLKFFLIASCSYFMDAISIVFPQQGKWAQFSLFVFWNFSPLCLLAFAIGQTHSWRRNIWWCETVVILKFLTVLWVGWLGWHLTTSHSWQTGWPWEPWLEMSSVYTSFSCSGHRDFACCFQDGSKDGENGAAWPSLLRLKLGTQVTLLPVTFCSSK